MISSWSEVEDLMDRSEASKFDSQAKENSIAEETVREPRQIEGAGERNPARAEINSVQTTVLQGYLR